MYIVTSLVNYFGIWGGNCDRTPSILIMVVDIAITTRRMKTVLCRSDIRIFHDYYWFFFYLLLLLFFNWCNNIKSGYFYLLFSDFQANDGLNTSSACPCNPHAVLQPPFRILLMQNSFISSKYFHTAFVTSTFTMFLCVTVKNTRISQLREKKASHRVAEQWYNF